MYLRSSRRQPHGRLRSTTAGKRSENTNHSLSFAHSQCVDAEAVASCDLELGSGLDLVRIHCQRLNYIYLILMCSSASSSWGRQRRCWTHWMTLRTCAVWVISLGWLQAYWLTGDSFSAFSSALWWSGGIHRTIVTYVTGFGEKIHVFDLKRDII